VTNFDASIRHKLGSAVQLPKFRSVGTGHGGHTVYSRVYFRISLKRWQTHRSKLQGGQIQIQGGGGVNHMILLSIGKANFPHGNGLLLKAVGLCVCKSGQHVETQLESESD
jgi:hypothetical protein